MLIVWGSFKPPSTSNKMLNPSVNYVRTKTRVKFNGDCLKLEKLSFDHGTFTLLMK